MSGGFTDLRKLPNVPERIEFRTGGASVNLVHVGMRIFFVRDLFSENRGFGQARSVMDNACLWADQNQITLVLRCMPYGDKPLDSDIPELSIKELYKFYLRLGFIGTFTNAYNTRPPIHMYRPHKYQNLTDALNQAQNTTKGN